ncbi:integrase [Sphingomonas corticis]|uniref:Integrase n=1 Tax=Sphingomonas corticis TaxID=2722791 RepID=A0ABX1CPK6_9SPHN|nr:integrase [Sphingomonas corticis]NJR79888.1 integrase [Sphingomonas corticis]
MPAIDNVTRRGAVYWWRRRVRFVAGDLPPITVVTMVSLQTKEQAVARRRGAAMTGRSEVVRMSLYEKIEREGLTADQATSLFQAEMLRYRNMLAYQHSLIQADGEGNVPARFAQMLAIYAALNGDFAVNGFADYMGIDYVGGFDQRFAGLDDEARGHLGALLGRAGDLPANLLAEARALMDRVGIAATGYRAENARRIMCEARAVAAATYDDPAVRDTASALALVRALASGAAPAAIIAVPQEPPRPSEPPAPPASILTVEQQRHAAMTPVEAVEEYIRIKPKARGAGAVSASAQQGRKSQAKVWGESQRRQFRAAAFLFGKSNGGGPLAATSQDHLNDFYDRLNRLPSSHHKSPRHEPMALEAICEEAAARQAEDAGGVSIGLDVGTINRHFANLKRLCSWMAGKTPMGPLDFSDFILDEDDRDDRDERDAYTIEQGLELFRLPIWTGGASLDDRLAVGPAGSIWHDAAYWVMPIVWYSGMRREEACKLLIDDIDEEDGIAFFNIRKTHAGTVKTATSVRKVPINGELRRLGLLDYVAAMKAAGETYLFPEIIPGRGGRTLGDVFFKTVWLNIKPHLTLVKPGQAVHSGRHMVSTELKMLQTFEEFRADLLGQKAGGENAGRYADATRLELLLEVVERIPVVTAHLPDATTINLLPKARRQPRPVRPSSGRRQRGASPAAA